MTTENKKLAPPKFDVKTLQVDFEVDKYIKELEEYTADFALVITDDNIANGKKAAAELNKIGKQLSALIKEKLEPTKTRMAEVKDGEKKLLAVIADRREKINTQIEALEQKHLDLALKLLTEWLEECRVDYRVKDEFRSDFNVQSEVKLGALNSKRDSLAKSARDKIENVVAKEKSLQQQTELRLSNLTNICNSAGLDAPLERRHVETFLFADEDTYQANLKAYMDAELDRQKAADERRKKEEAERIKAAEDKAREEATAEANRAADERRRKEEQERVAEQQRQNEEQAKQSQVVSDDHKSRAAAIVGSTSKPADSETKTVQVWVRFDIGPIRSEIPNNVVGQKVKEELEALGKNVVEVRA